MFLQCKPEQLTFISELSKATRRSEDNCFTPESTSLKCLEITHCVFLHRHQHHGMKTQPANGGQTVVCAFSKLSPDYILIPSVETKRQCLILP